jgi:hypothetical protein
VPPYCGLRVAFIVVSAFAAAKDLNSPKALAPVFFGRADLLRGAGLTRLPLLSRFIPLQA